MAHQNAPPLGELVVLDTLSRLSLPCPSSPFQLPGGYFWAWGDLALAKVEGKDGVF